jgi:hypothetical protein
MKRLTVKPKATKKKKKRIENAPHWTQAGTVAERRKVLDTLHTNRQFSQELTANRLQDQLRTMKSERDRLGSMRDLERPGMEFYARRRERLQGEIERTRTNMRAYVARPNVLL